MVIAIQPELAIDISAEILSVPSMSALTAASLDNATHALIRVASYVLEYRSCISEPVVAHPSLEKAVDILYLDFCLQRY